MSGRKVRVAPHRSYRMQYFYLSNWRFCGSLPPSGSSASRHAPPVRSFPGSIHDPARRRAPFAASRVHRVGVAFPEGLKLLPFYENLAKRQLLPFYAHSLSVTFTV